MSSNNDVINVLNILGRNHGKKFPKLSQTSFSGIVYESDIDLNWNICPMQEISLNIFGKPRHVVTWSRCDVLKMNLIVRTGDN